MKKWVQIDGGFGVILMAPLAPVYAFGKPLARFRSTQPMGDSSGMPN
jgi:hypothetical protein